MQIWLRARPGGKPRTRWTLFCFAITLWKWILTLPQCMKEWKRDQVWRRKRTGGREPPLQQDKDGNGNKWRHISVNLCVCVAVVSTLPPAHSCSQFLLCTQTGGVCVRLHLSDRLSPVSGHISIADCSAGITTRSHRHTEVHNYQLQRNNTDTTGSAGCLECLSSHGVSLHYNNVGDCSSCLSICPWQVILWLMCLQKSAVEIITACLAPCFLLAQPSVYLSCHLGKAGLQEIVCVFVWVRVSLMKCWNNNSTGGGRRCYRGIKCPSVKKVEFW